MSRVSVGSLLIIFTLVICLARCLPDFSTLKIQFFPKELIWEDALSPWKCCVSPNPWTFTIYSDNDEFYLNYLWQGWLLYSTFLSICLHLWVDLLLKKKGFPFLLSILCLIGISINSWIKKKYFSVVKCRV